MRHFNIKSLVSLDLNIYAINGTSRHINRWGKQQKKNVLGIYRNQFIVLELLPMFIDIKKIIYITNNICYNYGSCLSCFLLSTGYNKELYDPTKDKKNFISNFFLAFIDQWYGLISNFEMFINYRSAFPSKVCKITNYNRFTIPDLIFMGDRSWKIHDTFFYIFIRNRIVSIKAGSFFQNNINACYSLFVGNSFEIYKMLKVIYIYYKKLRNNKW
jgi:hypothetical protein